MGKINFNAWLKEISKFSQNQKLLDRVANRVIKLANIGCNQKVLDLGTGLGLLAFKVREKYNSCSLWGIDINEENIKYCREIAENKGIKDLNFALGDIENMPYEANFFDRILSRSVLMHTQDKKKAINEVYRVLKNKGHISLFEALMYDKTDRLYHHIDKKTSNYLFYKQVEEKVRNEDYDPLTNYDFKTIKNALKEAGFKNIRFIFGEDRELVSFPKNIAEVNVDYVFYYGAPHHYSLEEKFLKYMTQEQFELYKAILRKQLCGKKFYIKIVYANILAEKNIKKTFFQKIKNLLKQQN